MRARGPSGAAIQALDVILGRMKAKVSDEIKRDDQRVAEAGRADEAISADDSEYPSRERAGWPGGRGQPRSAAHRRSTEIQFHAPAALGSGRGSVHSRFAGGREDDGRAFRGLSGGWERELERAIANFFLDIHTKESGYTEILPPFLVNTASLTGVGQLPKFAADMFHLEGTDLWLTPTALVELTNLYRDETLDGDSLPIKVCWRTWTCFRSEAGAAQAKIRAGSSGSTSSRKWSFSSSRGPSRATTSLRSWFTRRRKAARKARAALSRGATPHRRHGFCFVEDVRHRCLDAGGGGIHGDFSNT